MENPELNEVSSSVEKARKTLLAMPAVTPEIVQLLEDILVRHCSDATDCRFFSTITTNEPERPPSDPTAFVPKFAERQGIHEPQIIEPMVTFARARIAQIRTIDAYIDEDPDD